MKINNNIANIIIRGAGPTGALCSLGLAKKGIQVLIVDPSPKEKIIDKSRAYAITHSSRRLFEKLDLWDRLIEYVFPFNELEVIDSEMRNKINFTQNDLKDRNYKYKSLGWIIDHKDLMNILFNKIEGCKNISHNFGEKYNFSDLEYDMQIIAEGSLSPNRKKLGINVFNTNYKCGCITVKVYIRGIIPMKAYEIFREDGPLAILPMGHNIYQVVITAPLAKCKILLKLNEHMFLDRLAAILPFGFNPDLMIDKPTLYPVGITIATLLSKGNTILLGESAHKYHPVGGQGLNVCFRDIYFLLKEFDYSREKNRISRIFKNYSLNRYPDIIITALLTHSLLKIYSNRNLLLLLLRYPLLKIVSYSRTLRRLIFSVMTDGLNLKH